MNWFTSFKIRLAFIGFLPSLLFAGLSIFFIYLFTDLPEIDFRYFVSCAALICAILIPLSIWSDRKWQAPLVNLINRYSRGEPLSAQEIHDIHHLGLRFPIYTYVINLIWWLVGTLVGCGTFYLLKCSGRDIFYVMTTAMTGGILSALVQFYSVKFFLWKTLSEILSRVPVQDRGEVEVPLTIRSKLLLCFVSVIFPALIFSGLMAYSAVFKKIRDEDIRHQTFVGQAMVRDLAATLHEQGAPADLNPFFMSYRIRGLQIPVYLVDRTGRVLYGGSPLPLTPGELAETLQRGQDRSLELGQSATVLCFFLPDRGPLLILACPWFIYSDAIEGIRWMLTATSLTLFVSLIILTFLASHDISMPVKTLKEKAKKVAQGILSEGVQVFSDDEVGDLACSLREMTTRLEESNRLLDRKVKERTQSLENAYNEMVKLNKLKDDFLSSVSHELRTPLTSIRSFSEILLNYPQEDKATQREFLCIIKQESERLTRLVNDLLDLAKIESGKTQWENQEVQLPPILQAVSRSFDALKDGKNLRFFVNAASDLLPLYMDPDRLIQVITNLISNAVKFTPPGGTIGIAVDLLEGKRSDDKGKMVRFCVSDTGIGIPKEDQDRVFEKFVQSWTPRGEKPKGTGLGLPICREIVQHYGGNMWVDSSPGQGTRMTFTLPCWQETQPRPAMEPPLSMKRPDCQSRAASAPSGGARQEPAAPPAPLAFEGTDIPAGKSGQPAV